MSGLTPHRHLQSLRLLSPSLVVLVRCDGVWGVWGVGVEAFSFRGPCTLPADTRLFNFVGKQTSVPMPLFLSQLREHEYMIMPPSLSLGGLPGFGEEGGCVGGGGGGHCCLCFFVFTCCWVFFCLFVCCCFFAGSVVVHIVSKSLTAPYRPGRPPMMQCGEWLARVINTEQNVSRNVSKRAFSASTYFRQK